MKCNGFSSAFWILTPDFFRHQHSDPGTTHVEREG